MPLPPQGPPSRTLSAEWYASHGIDLHVQGDDNAANYLVPKSLGIFRTVPSTLHMHTSHIINHFTAPRVRACVVGDNGAAMLLAAVLAARVDTETTVLTSQPETWSKRIQVLHSSDKLYCTGELRAVGSDPAELVAEADVVLLTGPPASADATLARVAPHLRAGALLGYMRGTTSFLQLAHKHLVDREVDVFATQEQPYITRVVEHGRVVRFDGRAVSLAVAAMAPDRTAVVAKRVTSLLGIPCAPLASGEAGALALTTSLLRVIRMYSLFHHWTDRAAGWPRPPLAFAEWDVDAVDMALACDAELQAVRRAADMDTSGSALEQLFLRTFSHQVKDTSSLLAMLRSNVALARMEVPMVRREARGDWVPDGAAPLLAEAVEHGLLMIKDQALRLRVPTPRIDDVLQWAQRMLGGKVQVEDASTEDIGGPVLS